MKILFLSVREPSLNGKADQITTIKLINYLKKSNNNVDLIYKKGADLILKRSNISKLYKITKYNFYNYLLNLIDYFFSNKPFQVILFQNNKLSKFIKKIISKNEYDLVYCHSIRATQWLNNISNIKKVCAQQNSLFLNYCRLIKFSKKNMNLFYLCFYKTELERCRKYELNLIKNFNIINLVSKKDLQYLLKLNKKSFSKYEKNYSFIPHGVDCSAYDFKKNSNKKKYDFIFLANFKSESNYQSLSIFLKEIYPLIYNKNNNILTKICGRGLFKFLENYKKRNIIPKEITFEDEVVDNNFEIASAKIFINPVYICSGMQNKILNALANGIQVVTTYQGFEGINQIPSNFVHVVKSNNFNDFADMSIKALSKFDNGTFSEREAILYINRYWSWDFHHKRLLQVLKK